MKQLLTIFKYYQGLNFLGAALLVDIKGKHCLACLMCLKCSNRRQAAQLEWMKG